MELRDIFKILSYGVSKKGYPIWADQVMSKGDGYLMTSNLSVYVRVKCDELQFKGSMDFYPLYQMINRFDDLRFTLRGSEEEPKMVVESESGKFKGHILVAEIPDIPIPNIPPDGINVDILSDYLELCSPFLGRDMGDYTGYINFMNGSAYVGDATRLLKIPDCVSKDVDGALYGGFIPLLSYGDELTFYKDGNVWMVKFRDVDGIAVVSAQPHTPIPKGAETLFNQIGDNIPICSISDLKKAVRDVGIALYKETVKSIDLENSNNVLRVKAESGLLGEMVAEIDSLCNIEFSTCVNMERLMSIPDGFTFCYHQRIEDVLVFRKDDVTCLVAPIRRV